MSGLRIPEAYRNLVRRARAAGWRSSIWQPPAADLAGRAAVIASWSPGGRRSDKNESARTPAD